MNSLLNKYAPFKKSINMNLNLKPNLGLHLVYKNRSPLHITEEK